MATKLVTNKLRTHAARQIIESVTENGSLDSNSVYYLFVGDHDPDVTALSEILESEDEVTFDPYRNMIAGKRVTGSDLTMCIRNIPYESSKVFDMYDDQDQELYEKDYFAITEEGSYFHVYKCLDNNMGAPSTVQPDFSHITGSNTIVYQTSDGYRWKYMYSVSDTQELKFATADYFPVFANSDVSGNAIAGAIDIIKVDGTGQGYDNYITGTLQSAEIRVGGNGQVYQISNVTAKTSNSFYNGCLMYLTTGDGAGQYLKVWNYISNTTGKYVVLANSFVISPTNGTEYEIYPAVNVVGNGVDKANCTARALVNSLASNSVYRVEMIDRGYNYDNIISANVYADPSVAVPLPAELRPINSPSDGHGADAAKELGANSLVFSVKLSNTENDTIPAINSFKQIGLLKDPIFANVSIETNNQIGSFSVGEYMYKVVPMRVEISANLSSTSANVDAPNADFENQFSSGEWIYLTANDMSSQQLTTVSSVTNSSQLVLTTSGGFNSTNCFVYRTEVYLKGTVKSSNVSHVLLNNVQGTLSTNDVIIGLTSGGQAQVNTVSISGVTKGFETFVQMYKYNGLLNSGTFQEDEYINQSTTNASALVHSTIVSGSDITLYATKQNGEFNSGGTNTVIGNTSGAVMRLDEKVPPELNYGSGDIIFIENVDEVTRSNTTNETFQIVISF